jgi:NAD-dependent dihydropyrimidine dehydrogenase PreA subunit
MPAILGVSPTGALPAILPVCGQRRVGRWGRPGGPGGRRGTPRKRGTDVTYVIAQPCVDLKDKACIEECPVDCIYEGERMLYIHPDECVDCGACEPVCPVEAIFYEDDTPEQWKDYYKANVEFFDDLGSPGGASKLGLIEKDHPLIAALPPQETAVT